MVIIVLGTWPECSHGTPQILRSFECLFKEISTYDFFRDLFNFCTCFLSILSCSKLYAVGFFLTNLALCSRLLIRERNSLLTQGAWCIRALMCLIGICLFTMSMKISWKRLAAVSTSFSRNTGDLFRH